MVLSECPSKLMNRFPVLNTKVRNRRPPTGQSYESSTIVFDRAPPSLNAVVGTLFCLPNRVCLFFKRLLSLKSNEIDTGLKLVSQLWEKVVWDAKEFQWKVSSLGDLWIKALFLETAA